MLRSVFACVALLVVFGTVSTTNAHITFKKELSKKYPDMKVSCNACHVKGKGKSERNEFGKLFAKELKSKDITANFKAKKGDEKKQFEKEVAIPAFTEALKKIKKMKNKKADKTYDELIKAGEMPEITLKPKKEGSDSK